MTRDEDPAQLLAELRARVEEATGEIDELAGALAASRGVADDLETTVDVLLGLGGPVVLVVDDDRRIRALSRTAAIAGAAVGKPLSSAVPGDLFDRVAAALGSGARQTGRPLDCDGADVYPLPSGGAVLVLTGT